MNSTNDKIFIFRIPISDIDELYKSMVIYERHIHASKIEFDSKHKNDTIYSDIDEYITSHIAFRKYINNLRETNRTCGEKMYIDERQLEMDDDKLTVSKNKLRSHLDIFANSDTFSKNTKCCVNRSVDKYVNKSVDKSADTFENIERFMENIDPSNITLIIHNVYPKFWSAVEQRNSLNIDDKADHAIRQSLEHIRKFYEKI